METFRPFASRPLHDSGSARRVWLIQSVAVFVLAAIWSHWVFQLVVFTPVQVEEESFIEFWKWLGNGPRNLNFIGTQCLNRELNEDMVWVKLDADEHVVYEGETATSPTEDVRVFVGEVFEGDFNRWLRCRHDNEGENWFRKHTVNRDGNRRRPKFGKNGEKKQNDEEPLKKDEFKRQDCGSKKFFTP